MRKGYAFQVTVYTTSVIIIMLLGSQRIIDNYKDLENIPICSDCCFSTEGIVANRTTLKNTTYDCCIVDLNRVVICPPDPIARVIVLICLAVAYVILMACLARCEYMKTPTGASIQADVASVVPGDILV